jgi:hypothetical protein
MGGASSHRLPLIRGLSQRPPPWRRQLWWDGAAARQSSTERACSSCDSYFLFNQRAMKYVATNAAITPQMTPVRSFAKRRMTLVARRCVTAIPQKNRPSRS